MRIYVFQYYWDGGLTNNNPIIDEGTILVSPFAGESDICPRDESGSFYSIDFRGRISRVSSQTHILSFFLSMIL